MHPIVLVNPENFNYIFLIIYFFLLFLTHFTDIFQSVNFPLKYLKNHFILYPQYLPLMINEVINLFGFIYFSQFLLFYQVFEYFLFLKVFFYPERKQTFHLFHYFFLLSVRFKSWGGPFDILISNKFSFLSLNCNSYVIYSPYQYPML